MPTVTVTPGWQGPSTAAGTPPVVVQVAGVGPAGPTGAPGPNTVTGSTTTTLTGLLTGNGSVVSALAFPGGTTQYLRGDGTWQTVTSGGGTWGSITGTLSSQTDLQAALDARAVLGSANTFTVGGQVVQTTGATVGLSVDATTPSADPFRVRVGGTDVFRVNSSGRLVVPNGTSTSAPGLEFASSDLGAGPAGFRFFNGVISIIGNGNNVVTVGNGAFNLSSLVGFNMSGLAALSVPVPNALQVGTGFRDVYVHPQASTNNDNVYFYGADNGIFRARIRKTGTGPNLTLLASSGQTDAHLEYHGISSTSTQRVQAAVACGWADSTDATRAGRWTVGAYSTTTLQEGVRIDANSGGVRLGFYGVTAVARAALAANATDLATAITLVNDIKTKLVALGLCS